MARRTLTDSEILAQLPAARQRAERALRSSPHAQRARFDRAHRVFHVLLTNGASFTVPVDLVQTLHDASDKELADVRVSAAGLGLRWERLDADLSVAHLAAMAFGTEILLRAAGSAGGSARTSTKARAARLNGLKGGRPRKRSTGKTAA